MVTATLRGFTVSAKGSLNLSLDEIENLIAFKQWRRQDFILEGN